MKTHYTEASVFRALRQRYPKDQCALLPQVADRTGFTTRHADAVCMQLWPSRGLTIEGFEIKVSRSDWKSELAKPEKADVIYKFCDKWWIAAPPGIVQVEELPPTWGLLEVEHTEKGDDTVTVKVQAPKNEGVTPPTRLFIASLLRSLQAHEAPEAEVERRVNQQSARLHEQAREASTKDNKFLHEKLTKLEDQVRAFERASGLQISGWTTTENVATVGATVRAVLQKDAVLDRAIFSLQNTQRTTQTLNSEIESMIARLKEAKSSG